MIRPGYAAARALADEDQADRNDVLRAIDLLALAEALDVQQHDTGLTCPAHSQTGHSSPVGLFTGDDGIQRWRCHACGAGGTAVDFVLLAGVAETYREAMEFLRYALHVDVSIRTDDARDARPRREPAADEARTVRDRSLLAQCFSWAQTRGWQRHELEALGRSRVRFVEVQGRGLWLRLHGDESGEWWQDRAVGGQTDAQGDPVRWRSAPGRRSRLFVHRPSTNYQGRPLVCEGGTDFLTLMVIMRSHTPYPREPSAVIGLPGLSMVGHVPEGLDPIVIFDNDEAGDAARERIQGTHLYVPEPFGDINQWWAASRDADQLLDAINKESWG